MDSPAHNRRKEVKELFILLCEYVHYLKLKPSRKEVYKKLFPVKKFDDQHLRHLCNYLLKATEAFLLSQFTNTKKNINLLGIYRQRKLGNLFEHQYKKTLKKLTNSTHRHPEYFWQRYLLAKERYSWDAAHGRSGALNLAEQERWLHIATMGFKLRQACLSLADQQINNADYEIPLLSVYLKEASSPAFKGYPMLIIYAQIVHLYQPNDEIDYFQGFSENISQYIGIFPQAEARDLLLLGINFGIKSINRGHEPVLQQTLTLYQKGLENDLFLENGQLNVFTYNNIAGIAIRLNKLAWADQFITSYKPRLERKYREAVFALNAARLAYIKKDYETALQYLQTSNDRDFIHHMSTRILQLKIYVDTENFDQTMKHIRNTRTYLKRRNYTAYHVQNYSNILKLTEAYCKLPFYDKIAMEQWRNNINNTSPLTEKAWLWGLVKN